MRRGLAYTAWERNSLETFGLATSITHKRACNDLSLVKHDNSCCMGHVCISFANGTMRVVDNDAILRAFKRRHCKIWTADMKA